MIPFGGTFDNTSGDFSFYMDMSGVVEADDEIPSEISGLFGEMRFARSGMSRM